MASQTMSPVTVVSDNTIGNRAWSNPLYTRISDDARAETAAENMGNTPHDTAVLIVKGGAIGATDQTTDTSTTTSDAEYTFGGTTDLWGETWTPTDINGATFGFVISYSYGWADVGVTEYLKATNFGFSIPTGATITGIVATVEARHLISATTWSRPQVDHVELTVYYTSTVQVNATGEEFKSMESMQINIGDAWKDVTKVQINIGDAWKTVF